VMIVIVCGVAAQPVDEERSAPATSDVKPRNLETVFQRPAEANTEQLQQRQLLADTQHRFHPMARRTETQVESIQQSDDIFNMFH